MSKTTVVQTKRRRTPRFGFDEATDGRLAAMYEARHCVCAYCWGVLVERYDDERGGWLAECAAYGPDHQGVHHDAYKSATIATNTFAAWEVEDFYRRTEYAAGFGLTPPLTGEALQAKLAANKKALGRSGGGLD